VDGDFGEVGGLGGQDVLLHERLKALDVALGFGRRRKIHLAGTQLAGSLIKADPA
jgi:hypothetical protein